MYSLIFLTTAPCTLCLTCEYNWFDNDREGVSKRSIVGPTLALIQVNSKSVSFAYTFPDIRVYCTFCEWESRHVLYCYCPAKQQLKAAHSGLFLSASRNRAWPFPLRTSPSSYRVALLPSPHLCPNTSLAIELSHSAPKVIFKQHDH